MFEVGKCLFWSERKERGPQSDINLSTRPWRLPRSPECNDWMLTLSYVIPFISAMLHLITPSSSLAPVVLGSGLAVTLPHFPQSSGLDQTRPDLVASVIARSEIRLPSSPAAPWPPVTWTCGYLSPSALRMPLCNLIVSVLSRPSGHLFQTESTLAPWSVRVRRAAQSQHLKGELRSLIRFYDFFCLFSSPSQQPSPAPLVESWFKMQRAMLGRKLGNWMLVAPRLYCHVYAFCPALSFRLQRGRGITRI